MDPKRFGAFIAQQRRDLQMTQSQLAEQLHVTDKAVSRWERGLGFPDISSLEPLANALHLSIAELMRSEKQPPTETFSPESDSLLTDALTLAMQQRSAERRTILRISLGIALLVLIVLLIDQLSWLLFIGIFFPFACLCIGMALLIYGLYRRIRKHSPAHILRWAAIFLAVPALLTLTLFLVGIFGLGPVPQ